MVYTLPWLSGRPCLLDVIFPEEKDWMIWGDEFKGKITFEEKDATYNNSRAADFFTDYITLIESRKEDGAGLIDLWSFWTGTNILPARDVLLVKFDANTDFPIAETCFLSHTIPTNYHCFEEFTKYCDMALKYGALGFSFT